MDVRDLDVYVKLCDLHLNVWESCKRWPREERFELTSQVLRSSNSSPAQLAEKNGDRHVKNKIEGVNRARGEARESLHHLYIASRKGYISSGELATFNKNYNECIAMLNGLERYLEQRLPANEKK